MFQRKLRNLSTPPLSFYEIVVEEKMPASKPMLTKSLSKNFNGAKQRNPLAVSKNHGNVSVKKESRACHYDYNFLQLDIRL